MTHTAPFDFAQCETHDTTFALGDACKFHGRPMWEVYAEEADQQRGRAVRAETELEGGQFAIAEAVIEMTAAIDERRAVEAALTGGARVSFMQYTAGMSVVVKAVRNRVPAAALQHAHDVCERRGAYQA